MPASPRGFGEAGGAVLAGYQPTEINCCAETGIMLGAESWTFLPGAAPNLPGHPNGPPDPCWLFSLQADVFPETETKLLSHQWAAGGWRAENGSTAVLSRATGLGQISSKCSSFSHLDFTIFSSHLVKGCNLCCVCPFMSHYTLNERRDETYSLFKASKIGLINMSN